MTILEHIEKLVDLGYAYLPRLQPDISAVLNTRIIAHRGAHDHPQSIWENTKAAFARAQLLGCWGIEFDIHACADGQLVINHDPTLLRLWGHDVPIAAITRAELEILVPSIPNLPDIVACYGGVLHLFIELKSPFHACHTLQNALKSLTPCVDYHLLSLDETIFANLQGYFPSESMLLVAQHNNVRHYCNLSIEKKYGGVLGHYLLMQGNHLASLQAADQLAGVGFINSKYSLYRELNRGVQYCFTNNAQGILDYLKELQAPA
ncbi:MAG: glycerophosphodiester phosphodiesterase [Legionella sp.]